MNWDEVAGGAHPDDRAFAALSVAEQLGSLTQALHELDPMVDACATYNVARAVLHLADAYGIEDVGLRVTGLFLIGGSANLLRLFDEAALHFQRVLTEPTVPGLEFYRVQSAMNLGTMALAGIGSLDEALRLLRKANADVRRLGFSELAVAVGTNLGAVLRMTGDVHAARRVYEQTLAATDTAPVTALARGNLLGNLANLLTDHLGRHSEAIAYYRAAVAAFEEVGDPPKIVKHRIHLAAAAIVSAEFEIAETALAQAIDQVGLASDSLDQFLHVMSGVDLPPPTRAQFGRLLARMLERDDGLRGEIRANTIAVCAAERADAGDTVGMLHFLRLGGLECLGDSMLACKAVQSITASCGRTGQVGVLWPIVQALDMGSEEFRDDLKKRYVQETAIHWLAEQTRRVAGGEVGEQALIAECVRAAPVCGLAAVPTAPPEWLGLEGPRATAVFGRLRAALCPAEEKVFEYLQKAVLEARRHEQRENYADAAIAYRTAIRMADLLGAPGMQAGMRNNLGNAIRKQPGGLTAERYGTAMAVFREAATSARGLPSAEVRILGNIGEIMKEFDAGDVVERVEAAISVLRRAWELARTHRLAAQMPIIANNLANAIAGHPSVSPAMLAEAELLCEDGLDALPAIEEVDRRLSIEATLRNSRAKALMSLAELAGRPELFERALQDLVRALEIRENQGDADRVLVTLGNIVGVELDLRTPPATAQLAAHLERARRWQPQNRDASIFGGLLSNLAVAFRRRDDPAAMPLAREAVTVLEPIGSTRRYIGVCMSAANIHLHFLDAATARALCERGLKALEQLRETVGPAEHRVNITGDFVPLQDVLLAALEMQGAPREDLWWAAERGTARVVVETRSRRGAVLGPSRDWLESVLSARLPEDVLLMQVFKAPGHDIAAFALQRDGGRLVILPTMARAPLAGLLEASGGRLSAGTLSWPDVDPSTPAVLSQQLHWLGEWILAPLMTQVDLSTKRRVAVVADGFLGDLPWHAAIIPHLGPLGRLVEVVEVPSCSVLAGLLSQNTSSFRRAVLIACDPTQKLVQHFEEVQHAFSALAIPERKVLTDRTRPLSRRAVLEEIEGADLIHFTGHGTFVAENPHESGLVLSDGVLSSSLLEQAFGRHAPSLVVLSACESVKRSHGFWDASSLMSTWMGAGTRALVGSPWRVPDNVSAQCMRLFYDRLLDLGALGALASARRTLATSANAWNRDYAAAYKVLGWD